MSRATIGSLAGAAMLAGLASVAQAQAPAPAPAPTSPLSVYGAGTVSCATYLQDRTLRINADGWILGFWTGMNQESEANHQVGKSTDARGIVAEVTRVCRSQPVVPLYKTVRDIYKQMRSDGS